MVMPHPRLLASLIAVTAVLMLTVPAHAQSADVLDQIVAQFQSRAASWQSALQSFAINTFGILALIELAWAGIRLAFRGADMSEWLAELVNQIFLGFFYALLLNSVTWSQAIVNSFRQAASAAGGTGISPERCFYSRGGPAQKVMAQMSSGRRRQASG